MNLGLENNVAVIVGGARGLGRAIAEAFVAENASVVILDRDAIVHQTAKEILSGARFQRANVQAHQLDVVKRADVDKTFDEILKVHQRIDHVVYVVGMGSGQFGFPYWNVDPARWAPVFEVNLYGAVNVAQYVGPRMAEAKRGTFTFLSSVAGQIGSQTDPPYSAAKAALINFVQCMAKDLASFGVRANTICPGMVKTELNKSVWASWADKQSPETWKSYEDWTREKIEKIIPLKRWQTPEDIAAMAVFLASERAANVTGQTINVDGGFVMHC